MQAKDHLQYIVEEIHSAVFAAADSQGWPVIIRQEHCLRCGNCYEICPARAIERR